jgi:hypothetical protein
MRENEELFRTAGGVATMATLGVRSPARPFARRAESQTHLVREPDVLHCGLLALFVAGRRPPKPG